MTELVDDPAIVYERAAALIGTPYRWLGRSPAGLDCVGLVWQALGVVETEHPEYLAAQAAGVSYFMERRWERGGEAAIVACGKALAGFLTKHLLAVTVNDAQAGDVILLNVKSRVRTADHAGIFGVNELIHASRNKGVVSQPIEPRLRRRMLAAYRVR